MTGRRFGCRLFGMVLKVRDAVVFECVGGPLDGMTVGAQGREFVGGIDGSGPHLYVRTLDDSGAMYWEYRGAAAA